MTALACAVGLAGAALPASAAVVTVSLGTSAQDFTLTGLGSVPPGVGSFSMDQGSVVFDGTTSVFTLSGAIISGTPGYGTGTYSFVTSYLGAPDLNSVIGRSNPADISRLQYRSLAPDVTMAITLFTPSGTVSHNLYSGGAFSPGAGWSFVFSGPPVCTGVATCLHNPVGLTPGATMTGPVTIGVQFVIPDAPAVPEPASWALMIGGLALVGGLLRARTSQGRLSPA